jgi:hypothetical protein
MKPDSQCQRLNPVIRLTAEKDAKGEEKQAAISMSSHHKHNKKAANDNAIYYHHLTLRFCLLIISLITCAIFL